MYTVEIVERAADDEYTVDLFRDRVSVINDTVGEDTLTAINEALVVYNALTDDEKREAEGDYKVLQKYVGSYNKQANEHNRAAQTATSVAFNTISQTFSFLRELVTLIMRNLFNL